MILTKQTWEYECSSEGEAEKVVADKKANSGMEGYTVVNDKTVYKMKKDRKTGEVLEEKWVATITVSYLI